MVDEMIYVMQPEIAPSIDDFFYHPRRNNVRTSVSLSFIGYDLATRKLGELPGRRGEPQRAVKVLERPRRDNVDTAAWEPRLRTDAAGRARFSFEMPDSLTRWRLTGRAVDAKGLVGQQTAWVRSDKAFYAKWTSPDWQRVGDRAQASVALFNQGREAQEVEWAAQGTGVSQQGKLNLKPGANFVMLPLNADAVGALDLAITLRHQGKVVDTLATPLRRVPVAWSQPRELVLDVSSGAVALNLPADARNVRVTLAADPALGAFSRWVDDLVEYPYGCVEQTTSRMLPLSIALQSLSLDKTTTHSRCGIGRAVRWATALAALAGAGAVQAAPTPSLVWRSGDGAAAHAPAHAPAHVEAPVSAPLGSVWKLFVYSYLQTTNAQEPAYRCERAQREPGDEYCCEPGESIGRDAALQRSCGAYFDPKRLGLKDAEWQRFWAARNAPAWLHPLSSLQPATQVPITSLLDAMQRVPYGARLAARQALLPNTLRDAGLLGSLGSSPRFKTWSWFDAKGERWGGAVGWLADGSPFWFGGPGSGRIALQRHVELISSAWNARGLLHAPPDAAALQAQPCVDVNFFSRYPLTQVLRDDNKPAPLGPLAPLSRGGQYVLHFANGPKVVVPGQPEFLLTGSLKAPRLQARLPLEDYVARVVDREGDAREVSAARALAIAARSWLRQNSAPAAGADGGCLVVDDDSRAQRVSPRPPTQAARAAAAFTAGLVLSGAPIRYQLDGPQPQVMSWRQAVSASRAGMSIEGLLREAYPSATLAGWNDETDCQPMPRAAAWLAEREPRWRKVLRAETGYEPPDSAPQVCQLAQGVPHADLRRGRLYIREWTSRDGRVTLIHEYLHLAFRRHPNGRDETYIERLAQQLADS